MRCLTCAVRMFTSRAPQLVAGGTRCPRCGSEVALVAASELARDNVLEDAIPGRPV